MISHLLSLQQIQGAGRASGDIGQAGRGLLAAVRKRVEACGRVNLKLEALFPSSVGSDAAKLPSQPEPAPLPDIEGYEVESVLGHGGMGIVYRARHKKLNRVVAVKMLLPGAYAGPCELARLVREAEAIAALRHANIVQVHDSGECGGMPYFTMELLEGGDLGRKLAGVPLRPLDAARLTAMLADALQMAHRAGLVHRDLKPTNILLDSDGTPKITDFGLARHFGPDETLTLSGGCVGTPSYMSPEQAAGKSGAVGPGSDVYSLGAILYELLTGRPPFRAESPAATVLQVIHQEPAPPSRLNAKVPRDLETVSLKCLEKDPRRRYPSAAALGDDLRRFLDGRPIEARPLGWGARVVRWARRERAAAALVGTSLALAALAVGGGFWFQQQRASASAAAALRDGRAIAATEAAFSHAQDLQKLGHWPEARAALEVAPGLLGTSASNALRQRLRRAHADADMVVRLEETRLRLAEGVGVEGRLSPTPDQLYADVFNGYGINLTSLGPLDAASILRGSSIRDVLLAFLHDWHYWAPDANRVKLRALLEAADDDPWRRAFRDAQATNDFEKLAALARAPAAADQPAMLLSGLGGTLLVNGRAEEAWALLREAHRHHPGDFWLNHLVTVYLEQERSRDGARSLMLGRPWNNDEVGGSAGAPAGTERLELFDVSSRPAKGE